ncbi:MAG: lytic transglycosylase domain-containing protein [Deltaproteobacteria bacterium]|nr:lytic transglycosylase domain-containing protein [Deltaproteobacteria bacterium]
MQPRRLGLLVASAMLTTSIGLGGAPSEPGVPSTTATTTATTIATGRPAVDRAADADIVRERMERRSGPAPVPTEGIEAKIYTRLSRRHTALPLRERVALAHTIVREARARRLDPDLVLAVIEVESGGYHLAVSSVGAMGLMQLLPSTGEELAGKLGVDWHGDDTLFDPATNVKLGTAYLRQLADRYGDVNIALAAYNWGPGRIDRRLRRGANLPSRYIEQVMRAYDRDVSMASRRS